ncbi:hypothetical protein [Aestuariirhabdus sp. LZHN29]|uniref:hypothetical protein n=1 Tax=Aestuariirhabdus sp. LZHN29 TaxID=3417462 RepID=UPI003CF1E5A0
MNQQRPETTPPPEEGASQQPPVENPPLSFSGLLRPVHYDSYKSVPLHRNKYVALLASFSVSPLIGFYLMLTGIFSNDSGQAKPAGWGVKAAILVLNAWLLFSVVTQSGLYRHGYLSVPLPPAIEQHP